MDELAFTSATRLAADVRDRRVGCLELLDHFLARAEHHNTALNAVVAWQIEVARDRARGADAALARGEVWGPLHGVPMTVKESFNITGLPTTWGNPPWKDNIATENAVVVERLLQAGAIIAFLHVSVVERSGNSTVPPGAILEVRIGSGQKGQQITEILSVDTSTAAHELPRRARPEPRHTPPDQATVEEFGTVKFYAADKGFGFIVRDRGGKDIFVHASALNRAGISELAEGQRVAVDMVEGGKGPEAVSIRLI